MQHVVKSLSNEFNLHRPVFLHHHPTGSDSIIPPRSPGHTQSSVGMLLRVLESEDGVRNKENKGSFPKAGTELQYEHEKSSQPP